MKKFHDAAKSCHNIYVSSVALYTKGLTYKRCFDWQISLNLSAMQKFDAQYY